MVGFQHGSMDLKNMDQTGSSGTAVKLHFHANALNNNVLMKAVSFHVIKAEAIKLQQTTLFSSGPRQIEKKLDAAGAPVSTE